MRRISMANWPESDRAAFRHRWRTVGVGPGVFIENVPADDVGPMLEDVSGVIATDAVRGLAVEEPAGDGTVHVYILLGEPTAMEGMGDILASVGETGSG